MNEKACLIICASMTLGLHTIARSDTNDVRLSTAYMPTIQLSDAPSGDGLWERFKTNVNFQSTNIFSSDFHPLQYIQWEYWYRHNFASYRDKPGSTAIGSLSRSLEYSARETFAESSIMNWFEDRAEWAQGLGSLFKSSVGDTAEEELHPSDNSYRVIEESWWKDVSKKHIKYGVKAFSFRPYGYASLAVGAREDPPLFLNLRYYPFKLIRGRSLFDLDTRFELDASVRLADRWQMDFGSSYEPSVVGGSPGFVWRVSKRSGRGAFFAGIDTKATGYFFVGYTRSW